MKSVRPIIAFVVTLYVGVLAMKAIGHGSTTVAAIFATVMFTTVGAVTGYLYAATRSAQ
jgi:hypothetical protein